MKRSNKWKRVLGRNVLGIVAAAAVGVSPAVPVLAASGVDIPGTGVGSKEIQVTAEIGAAYVVSLPASITLRQGSRQDGAGGAVAGYWYDLRVGAAGKLDPMHQVYIRPQFPCTLTGAGSGAQVSMKPLDAAACTTAVWGKDTIGSCDWGTDGLANMVYSYCCADGHAVGIALDDIAYYDSYTGTLTVNFGIEEVAP